MPTTPSRRTARTRLADLEQPLTTPAWAAPAPGVALAPFTITRRRPGPHEVLIDILYCGVCHTDIHQVRDEWRRGIFPMVPGHEIVGRVAKAGEAVTRWKTGDSVGVGCFVDSCRECEACRAGEEQYCVGEGGPTFTYGDTERDGVTPTYGGYSTRITVDEGYVVRIPKGLRQSGAAPLLWDHHLVAAAPLRGPEGRPGRGGGARRIRAHGGQARPGDGRPGRRGEPFPCQA